MFMNTIANGLVSTSRLTSFCIYSRCRKFIETQMVNGRQQFGHVGHVDSAKVVDEILSVQLKTKLWDASTVGAFSRPLSDAWYQYDKSHRKIYRHQTSAISQNRLPLTDSINCLQTAQLRLKQDSTTCFRKSESTTGPDGHQSNDLSDHDYCKSHSSDVKERPDSSPEPSGYYPEGKPHWNQVQHVALVLSRTLPKFFYHGADYTIYNQEVYLENRIHNIKSKGLKNLWWNFGSYHIIGRITNAFIDMVVHNVTPMIDDGSVRVRFRVVSVSFLGALMFGMRGHWSYEYYLKHGRWRDAYAIFYVGDDGLVYHVVIDQVVPDEKPMKKENLLQRLMRQLGLVPASAAPSAATTVSRTNIQKASKKKMTDVQ